MIKGSTKADAYASVNIPVSGGALQTVVKRFGEGEEMTSEVQAVLNAPGTTSHTLAIWFKDDIDTLLLKLDELKEVDDRVTLPAKTMSTEGELLARMTEDGVQIWGLNQPLVSTTPFHMAGKKSMMDSLLKAKAEAGLGIGMPEAPDDLSL